MEPILNMILNKSDPPKELAPLLSKEKNPYASFFRADKVKYLCDVLDVSYFNAAFIFKKSSF